MLIEKYKKHLGLENITLLLIPFNQHNHHVNIFLKSVDFRKSNFWHDINKKLTVITNKSDTKTDFVFLAIGSMYRYRMGFSNNIDPLMIGIDDSTQNNDHIHHDQIKLLDSFIVHLVRSFHFMELEKIANHLYFINKDKLNIEGFVLSFIAFKNKKKLDVFLKILYDKLVGG